MSGINAPCGKCGRQPEVVYGPDIRFPEIRFPVKDHMQWRAQCPDCDGPTYTRRTREQALESWNAGHAALTTTPESN